MAKRFIVGAGPRGCRPGAGAPVARRRRGVRRPARRGDRHRRRGRPLRRALRRGAAHAGAAAAQVAGQPDARALARRPAREPLGQGHRAHRRACAPRRPSSASQDAADRLRGLLRTAKEVGAHLHVDMESMDSRDLITELVIELLNEPEFRDGPSAGIVLQAYLRDADEQLDRLLDGLRAAARPAHDPPRQGRLLGARDRRGAPARLDARRSSRPRSRATAASSASRSGCSTSAPLVRVAIASHNVRSIAHALAPLGARPRPRVPGPARPRRRPPGRRSPRMGLRVRTYCPVGDLVAGMSYLVRRLLENTSNDSFLLSRSRGADLDRLLRRPMTTSSTNRCSSCGARPCASSSSTRSPRSTRSCPGACRCCRRRPPRRRRRCARPTPAHPDRVVAEATTATAADVDAAVQAAAQAAPRVGGARRPRARRDPRRAAGELRRRRPLLAALAVRECAKPWAEADADVCEAIDFLEYYAQQAVALDGSQRRSSRCPASATRCATPPAASSPSSAPWNFPLAIPAGMVAAGLATGNGVVLKPAEQSPACALAVVEALPRRRRPAGRARASCPARATSARRSSPTPACTRSRSPAPAPSAWRSSSSAAELAPGQRHLKRVVAEMGGKNCVIVDADADLDDAVPALAYSAFGFAGQKCSAAAARARARADRRHAARAPARRGRGAAGRPGAALRRRRPAGDRARRAGARQRATSRSPRDEGARVYQPGEAPEHGYFVAPAVIDRLPARLARRRGGDLRPGARASQRVRVDRRGVRDRRRVSRSRSPAGCSRATPATVERVSARAAGRQPLRQPPHHRRDGRAPAVRRQPAVRHRHEGRRPGLPAALRRAARRHRGHDAPRAGGVSPWTGCRRSSTR